MNAASTLLVLKRAGHMEPVDYEKISRVVIWAAEGLRDVSASEVMLKAKLQFFNGIPTVQIHEALIKSAADLISEEFPDYQYLAARLAMFHIRKKAFGQFETPHLYEHVKKLVAQGLYDKSLLEDYTEAEFETMNGFLDHSRDMQFAYAAVSQLEGKYLVQNRVTGQIYESPQFLYLLIAASLFSGYPKETRLSYIRRFYEASSTSKVSLPTPIMSGVRTPTRQFSSCVLIEAADSLDAINATASSVVKYVSQRAGIGLNLGMIRALGSPIRGGEAFHTGLIPFFKHMQTAVKSCSQGGVRGGAATLFYPLWHLDVESLLVLKNNRGVDDNRVRHLDYGVQLNRLMYQRLIKGENITLFSPDNKSTPGLYEAFFADQDLFDELYLKYENDPFIRKESVPAVELFSSLMQERASTGRIYIQNVDHCNVHGPFKPDVAPIRMSNLCLEIALPTKPIHDLHDEDAEIALCTLIAFNLGAIDDLNELEDLADLAVRAVDALFDYQDYPIKAAKKSTLRRRSIGAGVINFAYKLAKSGVRYSDGSANALTHNIFEAIQYWMLKASMELAKEIGPCDAFHETKYADGILPIDTYSKAVDSFCSEPLKYDWESLRADIVKYGLRNSTMTALMPSETSSQVSNATNGVEPPRGYVSVKVSKDGVLKQVVPELHRLRDAYELLWQQPDNSGNLMLTAIMQKFVDQSISANTNYDPSKFPNGKVPMKTLLRDLVTAFKYGVKTLYYHNTRDGAGSEVTADGGDVHTVVADEASDDGCEGGACKI